jgi:hypothetical protein
MVVRLLAEHGHLDLLRREADDGDYECAERWHGCCGPAEPPATALTLLRPFVGTDRAARVVDDYAGYLAEAGDVDAAMAMLRPYGDGGPARGRMLFAKALIRAGRAEEAIAAIRARPATEQV